MKIGTKKNPIRISSLPMLLTCPGFHVLRRRELELNGEDEGGSKAQVGTAVGRAIELFHKGTGPKEAIETALGEFPDAEELDRTHVTGMASRYMEDVRNPQHSVVLPCSLELEVAGEINGIYYVGHLDQVRRADDGHLYLWDVKAGTMYGGAQMVNVYAAQLAHYSILATTHYGEPVYVGGIIRTRGYITKEAMKLPASMSPVFFEAGWADGVAEDIAAEVAHQIRRLQRNVVAISPGAACSFCPAGGVANCRPLIQKYLDA